MTTEIELLIESKPSLTEASKRNYRNRYKKIRESLNKNLSDVSEERLLKTLSEISNNNLESEKAYLNVMILMKQLYDQPHKKLLKHRDEIAKLIKEVHEKPEDIELPEYEQVKKYIDDLYEGSNKKYVINKLIFDYGVRNKDVNVFITDKPVNENDNYLIVGKNIEWIINDYKTSKSFGEKKIIINDEKLEKAIRTLPLNTWLLSGDENKPKDTNLAKIISRILFPGLTERLYFKINIINLQNKKNPLNNINKFSKMRGTSTETIEEFYNQLK
jgi:hypothetical protein